MPAGDHLLVASSAAGNQHVPFAQQADLPQDDLASVEFSPVYASLVTL